MGTFLKIAPQNSAVSFTDIDITNNVTSNEVDTNIINTTYLTSSFANFGTASGWFNGTFSGSFIGTISGSIDLDFVTPFYVTASKGLLSFLDNATLTILSTGSVANIFLIQDATGSAFAVNGEGVTRFKVFPSGSIPTPVQGGVYFDSYDMYIGTDDVAP